MCLVIPPWPRDRGMPEHIATSQKNHIGGSFTLQQATNGLSRYRPLQRNMASTDISLRQDSYSGTMCATFLTTWLVGACIMLSAPMSGKTAEATCRSTVTGRLDIRSLKSRVFGNTRKLRIWLPPHYVEEVSRAISGALLIGWPRSI